MFAGARGAGRVVKQLRALLALPKAHVMPCCFDAFSAALIEHQGFDLTFVSGFAVSAARLARPDTGLISYAEMADAARGICERVNIPVIGDGDTGYGSVVNVKRTVIGYAHAGLAGIMIEDQQSPKKCGHTPGKEVIGRADACLRLQAALDARDELDGDIVVMARTDARETLGFAEALYRMQKFEDMGADILFLEAPKSVEELLAFCKACPDTPKMANMIPGGETPWLQASALEALGIRIVAHPLELLMASQRAMQDCLRVLKQDKVMPSSELLVSFMELRDAVGFPQYYEEERRYARKTQDKSDH